MKYYKSTLNIEDAKKEYMETPKGNIFHIPSLGFSRYSPSYVITNEDIRWVSQLTKKEAHRVLTAAGSGDHPMFYALQGADHIDTFDISYCAKTAMDIKTAAIHKLPRDEYIQMLLNMHSARKISDIHGITKIIDSLPANTATFVKELDEYPLFSNGIDPSFYKETIPTAEEYDLMRQRISGPFKFIWSDLGSLHSHLIGEYDIINLSNILEYMTPEQIQKTLVSLRTYVKPEGYIMAQTGNWGISRNNKAFYEASQKFKRWAKIGLIKKDKTKVNSEIVVVLQRTR